MGRKAPLDAVGGTLNQFNHSEKQFEIIPSKSDQKTWEGICELIQREVTRTKRALCTVTATGR